MEIPLKSERAKDDPAIKILFLVLMLVVWVIFEFAIYFPLNGYRDANARIDKLETRIDEIHKAVVGVKP